MNKVKNKLFKIMKKLSENYMKPPVFKTLMKLFKNSQLRMKLIKV